MSYIASARRALGLSQKELGEKLGLNQSTISRFETGELEVDERTLLAIDALKMRAAGIAQTAAA